MALAARLHPLHSTEMPGAQSLRYQHRQGLPDHLGLLISEQACGARVPVFDQALVIRADDGVGSSLGHCLVALKAAAQDTIAHFELGAAFGNTLFQRRVCSHQRVLESFALHRVAQRSDDRLRV